MTGSHEQLEQLSAYLDGELTHAEQTALEAHLTSCPTCPLTLEALRGTLRELRELPEPEPTAQDRWALRAAIRRARAAETPASRWQRWAISASSAAAALMLIVGAVVLLTNGEPRRPDDDAAFTLGRAAEGRSIELVDQPFDQDSARALFAGITMSEAAPADAGPDTGGQMSIQRMGTPESLAEVEACEADLFGNQAIAREPLRTIEADYGSVPAYLLLYHLPSENRDELWVVARSDCRNVLLFEQRAR